MINPKPTFLILFLLVAGCQPSSEVDKCVEENIVEMCALLFPNSLHPENEIVTLDTKEQCGSFTRKQKAGFYREKCLKAQAGK